MAAGVGSGRYKACASAWMKRDRASSEFVAVKSRPQRWRPRKSKGVRAEKKVGARNASMPRYFFRVYHDRPEPDEEGEELAGCASRVARGNGDGGADHSGPRWEVASQQGLATGSDRRIREPAVRHPPLRRKTKVMAWANAEG
jgi:hypothetical protein